jgi:hypothetical protein
MTIFSLSEAWLYILDEYAVNALLIRVILPLMRTAFTQPCFSAFQRPKLATPVPTKTAVGITRGITDIRSRDYASFAMPPRVADGRTERAVWPVRGRWLVCRFQPRRDAEWSREEC